MEILRGAAISAKLKVWIEDQVKELGRIPKLAIVRVGEEPDDISYETGAMKKMRSFGLSSQRYVFPGDISDAEFKAAFHAINEDPSVDGILVLRPLPAQIVQEDIDAMIAPGKDLDGICLTNMGKVFAGDRTGFAPCTAEAVVQMLKQNGIAMSGKNAVVVGRSLVVGRHLAMLLLQENATVTICHTKTVDMQSVCRQADILVSCAGQAKLIDRSYVKPGAVVIDVGVNVDEAGRLCGDVDFEDIKDTAACATPVPGGVGAVTTAVLAAHLVRAARARDGK